MTGEWDTPVRLRLIDQRHDVPKEKRHGAVQLCGSLNDDEFCRKLWDFNCDGYDVYVVAQEVGSRLPEDEAANGTARHPFRMLPSEHRSQDNRCRTVEEGQGHGCTCFRSSEQEERNREHERRGDRSDRHARNAGTSG